jgi:hypothetical protein
VDFKPGDGFGRGPGHLGDQTVFVVDPPGSVRGFHDECASGANDADMDSLLGNDERATAGDTSLHA